jgi:glycolate oxidase FAD binding subunit
MAVRAELAAVCGAAHVRAANAGDGPGSGPAGVVAAPGDPAQAAAVLRIAADRGLALLPRAGGTKLDWGAPPSTVDIVVDLGRLNGAATHSADDGSATFGAGTRLRDVDAMLRPTGQRLALDPPSTAAGATVGGALAAAECGPLRQLTGPVAALVVGIDYIRPGGEVRRATGDEVAALCGSLGTLGLITSATLRLHPRPPATAWVHRSVRHPAELYELVMLLETTPLSVAAIETDWPPLDPMLARVPRPRQAPEEGGGPGAGGATGAARPAGAGGAAARWDRPPRTGSLAVQIEGTAASVADRARTAVTLLGGDSVITWQPPAWWGRDPFGPGDTVLRLVAPPAELHAVGYTLRDATAGAAALRGAVGAGVLSAAVPADLPADDLVGIVETMRHTLLARGGVCSVLRAPASVHERLLDSDPHVRAARERKERFDPAGRLSPGRLPLPLGDLGSPGW